MADAKRPTPPVEPTPPPPPKLARAAESGDPAVQYLLAEQETHRSNGDADRVADLGRRLADLGYE